MKNIGTLIPPPLTFMQRFLFSSILLLTPLVLLADFPVSLAQPGFEAGFEGWELGANDAGMSVVSAEAARTGNLGLKVTDTSTSIGSWLYSPKFPALPGAAYQLKFWSRIISGSGVGAYLLFYDANQNPIPPNSAFVLSIPSSAADWTSFTLDAIAPANAAYIAIQVHSYNANTVVAHFDDFSLQQVLQNPGFEQGLNGWIVGSNDAGMSQASTAASRVGNLGLRVTDASTSIGSWLYSPKFPAYSGVAYQLKFWARIVSGSGIGVYLVFYDANQQAIPPSSAFIRSIPTSTTQWTPFTLDAVAPPNTAYVAIQVHSYNGNTVVADFDSFSLSHAPVNFSSGFEDGLGGWIVGDADGGMSQSAADAARTGNLGLKVTDASTSAGSWLYSPRFKVVAGAAYEVDFWSRIVSGSGIGVYLIFYDANNELIPPGSAFLAMIPQGTAQWTPFNLCAVAPPGSAYAAVQVHSFSGNTVVAHFDDFTFSQYIPGFASGFENGLQDWILGADDGGMSQAVTSAARTGNLGLRVTDISTQTGSSLFSPAFPILEERAYELEFWARSVGGSGMGVYLRYLDANGNFLPNQPFAGAHLTVPSGQTEWRRLTLCHMPPSTATDVVIWLHSYNGSKVTVDLDDFVLREVPREFVKTYPKSNADIAFSSLKIYQSNGAAYRIPVQDWAGASQRVASGPWLSWFNSKKTQVNSWMMNHADRVSWKAGWWHDFVAPDGSRLIWTEEIPGEQVSHIMSESGMSVPITEKIAQAWVHGFRNKHMKIIRDAAYLYRIGGDDTYANWAASQLDFYANNYHLWPEHNDKQHPARLSLQALDEAVNIIELVDAARLLGNWAPAARRQLWNSRLFLPEAELFERSFQKIHNIAVWLRSAQAQIALLTGDEELWQHSLNGPSGLRAQLRLGITSDYIWFEQSMGYNQYVVDATAQFLVTAALYGRSGELAHEAAIIQNLVLAPMYIRFPNNRLPNPADTIGSISVPSQKLRDIYQTLPTWHGVYAASSIRNWSTLLDPPETNGVTPQLPSVESVHWESSRFALMKKSGWQVFFHYGQLNISHSQAEALNWSASFGDTSISIDPGTVSYGSSLNADYYRKGLNHNVPLVDGEGQQFWHPGEMLEFNPTLGRMTGEQANYRSNATARRTLHIENDGRLRDEVSLVLDNATKVGLSMHMEGTPTLPANFMPVANFAAGRPVSFNYWENVKSASFQNEAVIDVNFTGGLVMRVKFSTPGSFTLYYGESPNGSATPPRTRTGFYLEKEGSHSEAVFLTEFQPL